MRPLDWLLEPLLPDRSDRNSSRPTVKANHVPRRRHGMVASNGGLSAVFSHFDRSPLAYCAVIDCASLVVIAHL